MSGTSVTILIKFEICDERHDGNMHLTANVGQSRNLTVDLGLSQIVKSRTYAVTYMQASAVLWETKSDYCGST